MKLKSLILSFALTLFAVSGLLAQNGERVYIREFTNYTAGKTVLIIYEKGESKQVELDNLYNKKGESLKQFAEILEKYFQQGYKLIQTSSGAYAQYILEKP